MTRSDLKDFQKSMPWTDIWSKEFIQDKRVYSKYEHCIKNILGKAGALIQECELTDHYGHPTDKIGLDRARDGRALAFIIMSAFKAANVYPDEPIDLSEFIEKDLLRRGVINK